MNRNKCQRFFSEFFCASISDRALAAAFTRLKRIAAVLFSGVVMYSLDAMLVSIRSIHRHIRDAVVAATEVSRSEELAYVVEDGEGDTIYAIDRISEDLLVELFEREIAVHVPIVLIAEGLAEGKIVLPPGNSRMRRRVAGDRRSDRWHTLPDVSETKRMDIDWGCPKSWREHNSRRHQAGCSNGDPTREATSQ
jgi:hypothetical protein